MKNVKIKNFKGIKIVDVSTEKNMIVISGPNGAGKSSFCDAIMTALAGKDKAISRPIRNGESKATIEIELDGYKVQKVFSQSKNPTLHVTPTGGVEPLKSPQAWLNAHIGNLKFDPSEFARLKESEQRDLLMKIAGLNLREDDELINKLYDERRLIGREIDAMEKPSEEELKEARKYQDIEEVSVSELSQQLQEESRKNDYFNSAKGKMLNNDARIEELEAEINNLKNENSELAKVQDTEVDLEELRTKIQNAEHDNEVIRIAKAVLEAKEKQNKKEEEYKAKSAELDQARDTKKQLIEAAQYPIEGLSISDDGVLYKDVPFSQINDSQQLVIGTLIALALMPKDNPIKIIFIKLGSLLDENALAYLEKVSLEQDAQFVLELVGDNNKGFKIVEGEVVNE